MKADKQSMLLYAVTDRMWIGERTLSEQVEEALKGGATFIQLREKTLEYDEFLKEAKQIKEVTDRYQIPFVINDYVKVAVNCGADGVHIGQDDLGIEDVRKLVGPDRIVGVSVQTVEQAIAAEKNGADYLGAGSMFSTSTKMDAEMVTFETLKEICEAVNIPVVAIGGINQSNILELSGTGVDGAAIISAIFAASDIKEASRELHVLSTKMIQK
ncbi:thiamine phosphate synthase [Peribacillus psychrosaccharolyticus]|uniref:Thiamine-phosphate synthase n=1 Tax=Peribacillus psychrosaccharolyticus TaxID=1407 RepID=A0A974NQ88_PERPY|nr:thiamine phosphate synthase [Peribacillus psychrosaccharolyticus]MEC2057427.1 thiamine phosphate synthase [Peribacillus psychrosaccharolyticus]MED3745882.1 thiamine phosphate synthase [Peribacillus psychrosaccharolyticus]QQT01844.1 thiamine phosphate synthase [Peribacillus psychrosaccharolyticus]